MQCRIVKPFDWQIIRNSRVEIVIEGITQADCTAQIYSFDEYFTVAMHLRRPLTEVGVKVYPGDVGRAVIACTSWGRHVLSIRDADDVEIASSGVTLKFSEVTTWLPSPAQDDAADEFRFPVPLVSSDVSHLPGELGCDLPIAPDLSTLCGISPKADTLVGVCELSIARRLDGLDSLSIPFSIGTDDRVFKDMLDAASWTTNVPYVARFRDVLVEMPSGLVLLDSGFWSDSTLTPFFNDPDLRERPNLFRAHDRVGYFGAATTETQLLAANGIGHFPGIPMLLSNIGYRNHAHWVMNSLLAAYLCRDMIIAERVCVLVPEYSDYIVRSLMALGIKRGSIIVASRGFYHLSDMLFPSTLSTHVNRMPPPEVAAMFGAVRTHCVSTTRTVGPKRVYLTRKGSGAQRKIGNEDALIEALQRRGFVCIAPHELTFDEEVSAVAGAEVIVGQLGAAMMNIAFAPRQAWVVELASHNYASRDYWRLATTLGQKYVRVLVRIPGDDTEALLDFSFDVPLEATLASIDRVCEAAAGRHPR